MCIFSAKPGRFGQSLLLLGQNVDFLGQIWWSHGFAEKSPDLAEQFFDLAEKSPILAEKSAR